MRKKILLLIVALVCTPMLAGCTRDADVAAPVDVYIGEEYFITTVQNIIYNFDNYYGKTVSIEGVFFTHGIDTIYRMVMRQDLSC